MGTERTRERIYRNDKAEGYREETRGMERPDRRLFDVSRSFSTMYIAVVKAHSAEEAAQ